MRSKVDFQKLDGDDDSNDKLKAKYTVTGYPRLVFTDNTGVALLNHRGAPGSAEEFKEIIGRFTR
jgi:thioredoxin-related protein